jgi:hypothetical protein
MAASDGHAGPRRWGVAVACALHSLLFLGLALAASNASLGSAVVLAVLGGVHALTATHAAVGSHGLARSWLWLAALALGLLDALAAVWFGALAYLSGVYEGLGTELVYALLALFGLAVVLLVPLAAWGLAENAGLLERRRRSAPLALLALVVVPLLGALWGGRAARLELVTALPALVSDSEATLAPLVALQRKLQRRSGRAPLTTGSVARCREPVSASGVTLTASYVSRAKRTRVKSACVQASDLATAVALLGERLQEDASRAPIALDVVRGIHPLSHGLDWLDALKLRPGLDGVCREALCLMPWQLLGQGVFSTYRPMATIPDFQFGVEPERLWRALGAEAPGAGLDGLTRVVTDSYVIDGGRLTALSRLRRRDVSVSAESLLAAELGAERHVLESQLADGKFRYTLDPFSGEADTAAFNLPRQAGVTLALCELGRDTPEVRAAIERALGVMQGAARRHGANVGLNYDERDPRTMLGHNALPLVAFLRCSERVDHAFDPIIAELARLLLRLERADGGFHPSFDLATSQVIEGKEPLYTGGQAVLALVLLEARQRQRPSAELPALAELQAAVERAMQHYGTRYWTHPLRDFFFLEENWHCLAAREALDVHPNRAYEDFCLDYVRFKSRLVLESSSGVAADFDGGFGFGNIVPPHNTGAAGTGEALAAALAVKQRRGLDTSAESAHLRRLLGFLLRQQWSVDNCFVCQQPSVQGGLSEHTHSSTTRIDYAQHAWAALGHGARALGLARSRVP